jgi:2-C-methyl-D-erythritol 2,4-cyclodiphosphate synthase
MNQQMRVGQGWDLHQLKRGRPLILGGVPIPFDKGLDGHSDADALTHAVIDALLGAAGEGNIGKMFPDTDVQWHGASSMGLLIKVGTRLAERRWKIGNIDATIVAEAPKLGGFLPQMQDRIAQTLGITSDQISVKAKTAEGVGPEGTGLAISAQAVALLWRD